MGLRDADDLAICTFAIDADAIVVTKDEDFLLFAGMSGRSRLLWVRTGNLVNRLLLTRFEEAWTQIEGHFESGSWLVELR